MKAFYVPAVALTLAAPVFAAVTVASFVPSQRSPQPIGKAIAWTATALDTQAGPLTFRFNIRTPGASKFVMVKDFNLGTLNGSIWTSLPFVWVPTGVEGAYQLQVVIKDFTSGESSSRIVPFTVSPVAIDDPAVVPTDNPLVFLYSVPACPAGSMMRALFQQQAATQHPITTTNWTGCHPPATQTFEIAGMLPAQSTKCGRKLNPEPTLQADLSPASRPDLFRVQSRSRPSVPWFRPRTRVIPSSFTT